MGRHVLIVNDRKKDDISTFEEESVIIVTANRDDFQALKRNEYCSQGGIYILLGDNKRYVGQASGSVLKRLSSHEKSKEWWNRIIIITSLANNLGKDKTDYLERLLIEYFKEAGNLITDNLTIGNSSYIDRTSKIIADGLLATSLNILENVANINLFETVPTVSEITAELEEGIIDTKLSFIIRINGGQDVKGKSARNAYINFIKLLLKTPSYREVLIAEGEPLSRNEGNEGKYVGTKKRVSPGGMINTVEIESGIFLYTQFSKANLKTAILKVAKDVNIKVEIEF